MSYNDIQKDKIQATLIKVEALQKEYEVNLQQYQEAGKNYITVLQEATTDTSKINFTALKGRTWWGTGRLTEGTVNTREECENMCANSDKCSGATFNPVKRYCWTRSGDSSITVGRNDDYALITEQKAALSNMKYLNEKLLDLNNKITNELQNIKPEVKEQYEEKNQKHQELKMSYFKLLDQKIELDKQLQEYYSIEQEESNQSIYVNQQNISLRLWVLITCIIVLFTLKRVVGSVYLPISITIWLLIIILLIILTYSLSTPSGFFIWFVLLLIVFLMKTGNLPSI